MSNIIGTILNLCSNGVQSSVFAELYKALGGETNFATTNEYKLALYDIIYGKIDIVAAEVMSIITTKEHIISEIVCLFDKITPNGIHYINPIKFILQNWMLYLPEQVKQKNLSDLILPGSNHSAATKIMWDYSTEDASEIIKAVKQHPFIAKNIEQWLVLHSQPIKAQLEAGLRWFDINFSFVKNGFYATNEVVYQPLEDIFSAYKTFLDNHPGEIICININPDRLYIKETRLQFNALKDLILEYFKSYMSAEQNIANKSLHELVELNHRVILLTEHHWNAVLDNQLIVKAWHTRGVAEVNPNLSLETTYLPYFNLQYIKMQVPTDPYTTGIYADALSASEDYNKALNSVISMYQNINNIPNAITIDNPSIYHIENIIGYNLV